MGCCAEAALAAAKASAAQAVTKRTPVIANLRPSGEYLMEDFYDAGGLPALLERIAAVPGVHLVAHLYDVDADLRPEGRDGPLVRSLDAWRAYVERWAEPWECLARLKARALSAAAGAWRAIAWSATRRNNARSPLAAAYWKLPTRRWLLATRATHAVVVDDRTGRPIGVLSTLDVAGILGWGRG